MAAAAAGRTLGGITLEPAGFVLHAQPCCAVLCRAVLCRAMMCRAVLGQVRACHAPAAARGVGLSDEPCRPVAVQAERIVRPGVTCCGCLGTDRACEHCCTPGDGSSCCVWGDVHGLHWMLGGCKHCGCVRSLNADAGMQWPCMAAQIGRRRQQLQQRQQQQPHWAVVKLWLSFSVVVRR